MATPAISGMLKISFPGTDPRSIPTVSAVNVKRLPATVVSLFVNLGRLQDFGDLSVLTIDDPKHRPTVLRTVQWLENGEYEPFNNNTMLQVKRKVDLSPACYDERKHQNDTTFSATNTTYAFFLEEIKLYAFSVLAEFTELQRHSGWKIRFHYPVYAAEITALLTALARNKIQNLATVDHKLAEFMGKRISCCRKDLLDDKALLPFLRNAVEPRKHLKALIQQADHESVDKAIAQLSTGLPPDKQLSTLLDAFVDTTMSSAADSSTLSPMGMHATHRQNFNSEPHTVFRVLAEHRLIVAAQDGYGTLRVTHRGEQLEARRNTLFRFQKGELLLQLPVHERTVNGPNDLVVRNQQGEIGEVFKALQFRAVQDLTKRVPDRAKEGTPNTVTTRALPSPASIKSEEVGVKREYPVDDLFANRVSRQRLH